MSAVMSPVIEELRRQLSRPNSALVDLTRLWIAAGRPRGRSPRQWDARTTRGGGKSSIVGSGAVGLAGPDAPALAESSAARLYASYIDEAAFLAAGEALFLHGDGEDPLILALKGHPRAATFFALDQAASRRGVTYAELARSLIDEAIERTAGFDPFERETVVAEVQRAVRGEPHIGVRLGFLRSINPGAAGQGLGSGDSGRTPAVGESSPPLLPPGISVPGRT